MTPLLVQWRHATCPSNNSCRFRTSFFAALPLSRACDVTHRVIRNHDVIQSLSRDIGRRQPSSGSAAENGGDTDSMGRSLGTLPEFFVRIVW